LADPNFQRTAYDPFVYTDDRRLPTFSSLWGSMRVIATAAFVPPPFIREGFKPNLGGIWTLQRCRRWSNKSTTTGG
jgi:hypothetical protein